MISVITTDDRTRKFRYSESEIAGAEFRRLTDGFRNKVSLHAAISLLRYLATALAHLKADDYAHLLTVARRHAWSCPSLF